MAKEHPRYMSIEWPEWEFREFPMMVYPLNKVDPRLPTYAKSGKQKGKPIAGVIVQDEAELNEVLGLEPEPEADPAPRKGVKKLVAGAGNAQRLETEDDELAALQVEATELGVQFDKNWSLARLQDAIDTKKAEDADPVV